MRVRIGVGALLALAVLAAAPSESKAERSERIEVKQVAPAPIVSTPVVQVAIARTVVEVVSLSEVRAVERSRDVAPMGGRTPCVPPADASAVLNTTNPTLADSAGTLRLRSRHASASHTWRRSTNSRGRSLLTG